MSEQTSFKGLTPQQVLASRDKYGENVITPASKKSWWRAYLEKFTEPLIVILLVAGALSVGISLYEYFSLDEGLSVFFEPIGIFIAIFLATTMSYIFEAKADKEFALLNTVNDEDPVRVIRSEGVTEVPKKDVVVDDIVVLNTGDEIPADGILLESTSLNIDESSLTGEPSCYKSEDPAQNDPEATYPSNRLLRGTRVLEGHGIMRVDKVGDHTENGGLMTQAQIDNSVKTPLSEQLDKLGKLISIASYVIGFLIIVGRTIMFCASNPAGAASIFTLDYLLYFLQTLMIAVTLVVVSVPEGLPMAVTLSLAYSMRRMLRTNNLVRKMHACETMGAATVICTDKTGTLTQNRMQVASIFFPELPDEKLGDNAASRLLEEAIAINSSAQLDFTQQNPRALGNPTEGALLLWLLKNGLDYRQLREKMEILSELPFSTERKYMATLAREKISGKYYLFAKGAPEIIMERIGLTGPDAIKFNQKLLEYQNNAMRTLALAYKEIPADGIGLDIKDPEMLKGMTMQGIFAIADPVREEVPEAVQQCRNAGVDIKIVTGDTTATARQIGRNIGMWDDTDTDRNIITGPEFAALSDDELKKRIKDIKIIARARPSDKKRLVETLQELDQVVAVTGDGTNDAPALKAAHVGLSMGDGTSVAKEASDITIVDNSFASIGKAIMWGRSLYLNIQRFILFQLTVNVAASLTVLAGAFMGTQSPLTVTQMLWVNLIMDTFAAVALASLPPSDKVMNKKPRSRKSFIINKPMAWMILGLGGLFFLILMGLIYLFEHADVTSLTELLHYHLGARDLLTPYELTMIFTIFVFLQFWNLFNAKAFATHRSTFHFKNCGEFLLIASLILIGQIVIVEVGGKFFSVTGLKFTDWVIIILATSLVMLIGEVCRQLTRKDS